MVTISSQTGEGEGRPPLPSGYFYTFQVEHHNAMAGKTDEMEGRADRRNNGWTDEQSFFCGEPATYNSLPDQGFCWPIILNLFAFFYILVICIFRWQSLFLLLLIKVLTQKLKWSVDCLKTVTFSVLLKINQKKSGRCHVCRVKCLYRGSEKLLHIIVAFKLSLKSISLILPHGSQAEDHLFRNPHKNILLRPS